MYRFVTALSVLLLASPVLAGEFDSGSNGTDGELNCAALMALDPANCAACDETCTVQIDLALAASLCDCDGGGQFDDPCESNCIGPVPGQGVYDASEWAVVFNYTTINIPAGVTVTFHNHPKGAPVMWLTTGNVIIAGQVRLDGADGSQAEDSSYAIPGPGGFSGGVRRLGGSHGFGPGGGATWFQQGVSRGGGGGYGTAGSTGASTGSAVYGTASIVPLIGGSGGALSAIVNPISGGAGGGAILIAASGDISLPDPLGGIFAIGGNASGFLAGSGSGGGIRLITNDIFGSGLLRATGGTQVNAGGKGRIRVEASTYDLDDFGDPQFPIITVLGDVFPDPVTGPILRATFVNNTSVPADPEATVRSGDVVFTAEEPVTIEIEAQNVPLGSIVQVRIIRAFGLSHIVNSTPLEDDGKGGLTATAEVTFINGASEVQLSVVVP